MKMQITLAGNQYRLHTFTLRQVREISSIVAGSLDTVSDNAERASRAWDRKYKVIVTALGRNYPEITLDSLDSMVATLAEVNTAYWEILKFADLIKADDTPEAPVLEAA
jgi:hypothetical protein